MILRNISCLVPAPAAKLMGLEPFDVTSEGAGDQNELKNAKRLKNQAYDRKRYCCSRNILTQRKLYGPAKRIRESSAIVAKRAIFSVLGCAEQ